MKKRCNCNIKRFINNIKKKLISGSNYDIANIAFRLFFHIELQKGFEKIENSRAHMHTSNHSFESSTRRPAET
jgi:hypothetical protein